MLSRVLLLEPNAHLRSIIQGLLDGEAYAVEACQSLEQVMHARHDGEQTVALVAWQSMEGLLAEEHRHNLVELTQRVPLIVMVPRRWARLLQSTELPDLVKLVAKPFEADELLDVLSHAFSPPVEA